MPVAVHHDRLLAPLTTIELGGPAARYCEVTTEAALVEVVRDADDAGVRLFVLGGGSNVVFADEGFAGLVVRIALGEESFDAAGCVTLGAGVPWAPFVDRAVARGLAGIECLAGIPGSAGATPVQNVGAYGQEIAEVLLEVRAYDREAGRVVVFDRDACEFGYRDSLFKRTAGRYVVLSVRFALEPGGAPAIRYAELERSLLGRTPTLTDTRDAVIRLRKNKSMVIEPEDPNRRSVGSFFTNPILTDADADAVIARIVDAQIAAAEEVPRFAAGAGRSKLSAAWLIERAGIRRGHRAGDVGVSSRHTLALVNHGGGTTRALLALADEIVARVHERFGVRLVPEPTIVR